MRFRHNQTIGFRYSHGANTPEKFQSPGYTVRLNIAPIAEALRKTTERLAQELVSPGADPPEWTEFEWRIAQAAAAMQGVSSLLSKELSWSGPDGWQRFLLEQRNQGIARHRKIAGVLDMLAHHAQGQHLAYVPLKGAALHALGIYEAGDRPMGDIDVLIREGDESKIERVLTLCEYVTQYETTRHRVFQPRNANPAPASSLGEHADNPIKIEVHTRISEPLPISAVDITDVIFPRCSNEGCNPYASKAALMMHLLLHAAGNMRARALRSIQLHDIAMLGRRFSADDWQDLFELRADQELWWTYPPLMLASRYYPGVSPPAVARRIASRCPSLLRRCAQRQRVAQVSWSNIRIEAFPGLEWSRTGMDALRFMRSRVWPTPEARRELSDGAAQIPQSGTVPWYGISHRARIVRWIFTRPPRVQTLLTVRAALEIR
jgi:Uncharacterised nucleotidyltransferase